MIIELKDICKQYQDSNFNLQDINLKISEAEKIGIIGKNGTGKSTILKIINGICDIDRGEIIYKNKNIKDFNQIENLNFKKKIAYIFQHFNLIENKSVFYHLSLIYKLNKTKVNNEEIDELLKFMGLKNHKYQLCTFLSGGQKQKLAIAMAILQKPEVILCDEISSALDNDSEKEIFKLLINLSNLNKISLVIVSHNLDILKQNCDRILYLENGRFNDQFIPKRKAKSSDDNYYNYVKRYLQDD